MSIAFLMNKLCQSPKNVLQNVLHLGCFWYISTNDLLNFPIKEVKPTWLVRVAKPAPWTGLLPHLDSCASLCQQSKLLLLNVNMDINIKIQTQDTNILESELQRSTYQVQRDKHVSLLSGIRDHPLKDPPAMSKF